jgi:hypothetical protein
VFSQLQRFLSRIRNIEQQNKKIQEALGRIENRQLGDLDASQIASAEFRVLFLDRIQEDAILKGLPLVEAP